MNYIPAHPPRRFLTDYEDHPQKEAARLKRLVASGKVAENRIELAADLGFAPAVTALARRAVMHANLSDFFLSFHQHTKCVWLRMTVAAVRSLLPIWERACPDDNSLAQALATAERWILDPRGTARHESGRLKAATQAMFLKTQAKGTPVFVARAAMHVGKAVAGAQENGCFASCYQAIKASMGCLACPDAINDDAVLAAENPPQAILHETICLIRHEVVPWALDYYDPVALRHST